LGFKGLTLHISRDTVQRFSFFVYPTKTRAYCVDVSLLQVWK